jgi:hypothetical protein
MKQGIEFVKHYKAHLGWKLIPSCWSAVARSVVTTCVTRRNHRCGCQCGRSSVVHRGRRLCESFFSGPDVSSFALTVSVGLQALKLYDVANFDMVYMLKLAYKPSCCAWIYPPGNPRPLLAVAEAAHARIHVYNVEAMGATEHDAAVSVLTFHRAPVLAMCYVPSKNCVISGDDMGVLEYWKADDFAFPAAAVTFRLKVRLVPQLLGSSRCPLTVFDVFTERHGPVRACKASNETNQHFCCP